MEGQIAEQVFCAGESGFFDFRYQLVFKTVSQTSPISVFSAAAITARRVLLQILKCLTYLEDFDQFIKSPFEYIFFCQFCSAKIFQTL